MVGACCADGLGWGAGNKCGAIWPKVRILLETPNLEESGANAALFGLSDALFGALPALAKSKLAPAVSSTNQSAQPAEM